MEQQLRKLISENFDEICSYPSFQDESFISDIHNCMQYKRVSDKYNESKILSFVTCTDGVALYNSSRKSLWAIQLYSNFLKPMRRYVPNNIMVVALHIGKYKPNMQNFYHPLMMELQRIKDNGGLAITKNNVSLSFMPVITHVCCDLPAKADVQGMIGHAGHYACGFCFHPGISLKKDNKGKSYVRYIDRGSDEIHRTHTSMVKTYQNLGSTAIKGIKSISCMIGEGDFDLVNGFGIDYMHCILLGVSNKLMDLWLNSTNHKQQYYIDRKGQNLLNMRIINIKPTSQITRKPRSIFERADYKANEVRSLLLYYLRYSLSGVLKNCYINNFHLLSSATYMLLKDRISKEGVDIAEKRLIEFANGFEKLYGPSNVTLNVHLVRHIGSAVRNLGL